MLDQQPLNTAFRGIKLLHDIPKHIQYKRDVVKHPQSYKYFN